MAEWRDGSPEPTVFALTRHPSASLPPAPCCSLFELDLHGLHAAEATAALDRRLHLLHGLLADPATAAAAGAPGAGHGGGRTLRVVVGRGAHSSGGEASLPRVVGAHLRAVGLRFCTRVGALDVQLRAAAALGAAGRAPG
jgi:hypothetical protein